MLPLADANLSQAIGSNAASTSSSSTETVVTIVFGIFAAVASVVTIWQGYLAWKIWHQASLRHRLSYAGPNPARGGRITNVEQELSDLTPVETSTQVDDILNQVNIALPQTISINPKPSKSHPTSTNKINSTISPLPLRITRPSSPPVPTEQSDNKTMNPPPTDGGITGFRDSANKMATFSQRANPAKG